MATHPGGTVTRLLIVGMVLIFVAPAPSASAQKHWAQFRGSNAGDIPDDPSLPERWSETENIAWRVAVPGLSWSSPVVWHDHIFVTTAISAGEEPTPIKGLYDPGDNGSRASTNEHHWMLYDIDFETGHIQWQRELHTMVPTIARHLKNSFASETPVTYGRRVYVYLGSIGLVTALNMSGETVWRQEIGAFDTTLGFGSAASPVLHDDRLYVVNDNTTHSFMVALDTRTGEEIWRVDREERGQNWATPLVWENELRTEIVTSGTGGIRSYDLDGGLRWELHGMSGLTIPTPFARHGLLYLSSGYPGGGLRPVYAVRPGASGDISVWPPDLIRTGIFLWVSRPEGVDGIRRVGLSVARNLQYLRARLWRVLLHLARPRLLGLPRCPDRRRSVRTPASGDWQRIHGFALGIQRKDLPSQRGR